MTRLVPCFASSMNTKTQYLSGISFRQAGLPLSEELGLKLFGLGTLCQEFGLAGCKSVLLRWMILFHLRVPITLWKNCKIQKCLFDFGHFLDAKQRTYEDCRFRFKSLEVVKAQRYFQAFSFSLIFLVSWIVLFLISDQYH
jgi:hypothetical protein